MITTLDQTVTQAPSSKADKFGTVDVGRDLFPPYVGVVTDWDIVDKKFTDKTSGEVREHDELMLVVDPSNTAIQSTDGMGRPSWKRSITKTGKTPPNSVYAVVLASIEKAVGFPIKTSADLDRMVGLTLSFGQVDPAKDPRFAKMTGDYAPKNPVILVEAPPVGWEDTIPADLDTQKIAKMAAAVAAAEAKRQSAEAGNGESVQAQVVTAPTNSGYDIDDDLASTLVTYLDGKEISKIGFTVYQDKDLKALVSDDIYLGLQNKSVQAQLEASNLLTRGRDLLYHAA